MNNINCFDDLKSLKSIPLDTVFEFDGEEWKNIPYDYYSDRYLVSDSGKSWSIKRHRQMNNHPNDKGYFGINLCKDGVYLAITPNTYYKYKKELKAKGYTIGSEQ